jgi:hypothetical protein
MTDELLTERLYGNYRAKVVDNKDKEMFGRILVWIPDIMPDIPDTQGLWARPANNPIGGRNAPANKGGGDLEENYYMGSSFIPRKGAWVWVFFEAGNINRPYYFGALDLENTPVLPENQYDKDVPNSGKNYEDKWTIFKSNDGRAIVISDDPDDKRVEITGRKKLMKSKDLTQPPTGDVYSVYRIISNQNTILLDERDGKEKILIKTHKGDFIHIDIDDSDLEIQFSRDMHLALGGNLFVRTQGEMHFLSGGGITMSTAGEINLFAGKRFNIETGDEFNRKVAKDSVEDVAGKKITKVGKECYLDMGKEYNVKAGGDINRDASPNIQDNSGYAKPAPPINVNTIIATPAEPEGKRET